MVLESIALRIGYGRVLESITFCIGDGNVLDSIPSDGVRKIFGKIHPLHVVCKSFGKFPPLYRERKSFGKNISSCKSGAIEIFMLDQTVTLCESNYVAQTLPATTFQGCPGQGFREVRAWHSLREPWDRGIKL